MVSRNKVRKNQSQCYGVEKLRRALTSVEMMLFEEQNEQLCPEVPSTCFVITRTRVKITAPKTKDLELAPRDQTSSSDSACTNSHMHTFIHI